ncbi:hypothetical protein NBRC116602_14830 [Hyphomicrobiales bacterium 4NK60-0047b]
MINRLSNTLVIAGMSVALLAGVAEAKNSKKDRFGDKVQKTDILKKKSKRAQKNRVAKRQIKRAALKQRAKLGKRQNNLAKRVNIKRPIKTNVKNKNRNALKEQLKRPIKRMRPLPDKRVTTPKAIVKTDKRVTTPKTVITQKNQDPTSGRLNARKNKDEYFKCAKFSTAVLNACMADANRKAQSTKPCLTHYQGNIGRCQAKFL